MQQTAYADYTGFQEFAECADNPVMHAIVERRSTRGFEPMALTQDQMETLTTAAIASPSAMNRQSWHFTFCSNSSAIKAVEAEVARLIMEGDDEAAKERMTARHGKVFYNAPTVVFISSDESSIWGAVDAGIAAENIVLAAQSMGLGSVIVGMCRIAFEGENGKTFAHTLHFPEGYRFSLAIAVGTPNVTKEAHEVGEGKVTMM